MLEPRNIIHANRESKKFQEYKLKSVRYLTQEYRRDNFQLIVSLSFFSNDKTTLNLIIT